MYMEKVEKLLKFKLGSHFRVYASRKVRFTSKRKTPQLEDDIIGIATDGASVMKKLGKILEIDQQLCFTYALQLAVITVLYKKDASHLEVDESLDDENTVFANLDDEDKDDDYNSEYVYGDEDCTQDSNNSLLIIETSEVTIKHQIIGPIITKVRKT